MPKRYIVAIDAGTTSVRTALYDTRSGVMVRSFSSRISQSYPHSGWVDQDGAEIWARIRENLSKTVYGLKESDIYGMGITNQRETVVMWDKETGIPIAPAICWQCKRTEKFCKKLYSDDKKRKMIQKKTGLIVNSYFSASKIKWMLDNVYDGIKLYKQGRLCCGTLESYLIFRLTNGSCFVTEPSNASRTMLYNIHTNDWDDELLNMFGVPRKILPDIVDSNSYIGDVYIDGINIKLGGVLGDQQASLMGQACFDEGNIKNTYGTGSFLLLNIGEKIKIRNTKMLTTVAWRLNGKTTYALEGSIFNAGSCINWLTDRAELLSSPSESGKLALSVDNSLGVKFVPAFSGLGAPFWDDSMRAGFYNITLGATRAHMVRSVLESIAYSVRAIVDQMQKDTKVKITDVRVDGGMTANDFFVQYQSDLLGQQILVAKEPESTSLGAAFVCGLAFGAFSDFDDLRKMYKIGKVFKPSINKEQAIENYQDWLKLVKNMIKSEK